MDNLNRSGEQIPEKEDTSSISLLRNPQRFKQKFFQLTCTTSEALKNQQYDKAIDALNKCIDMMDLGKNILKDISKYWKVCIYGNLACAYQGTWKMQKCHKYCSEVQKQLEKLLDQAQGKQDVLNLTKNIIIIRFQHCAILSQLNHHDKALQMCKSTFPFLEQYIQTILEYAQSISANNKKRESSQTVQFSKQVSTFAQEILKNLLRNLNEPVVLTIDKSSFYYWQKNPENNEEQVKKKFVSGKDSNSCKRSILGVNKMTHWIDEFNIGTIMHMSQFTLNSYQHPLPLQQYIFKDKLYEIVIYCSVAHFTIATQMRFIENNKQKTEPEKQKVEQHSHQHKANSIIKKYGYEQRSDIFKLSELYHLKAINIMAQNIKATVPYIAHLIKSYDKHYIYKKELEPVIAIDEQSLISQPEIQHRHQKFQEESKEQEIFREEEDENCYLLNPVEANEPIEQENQSYPSQFNQQKQVSSERQPGLSKAEQEDKRIIPSFVSPPRVRDNNKSKFIKNNLKTTRQKTKSSRCLHEQVKPRPTKKKEKVKEEKIGSQTKESKDGKQSKKKKPQQLQGQVRINHQSCTQIKVVFKKKK